MKKFPKFKLGQDQKMKLIELLLIIGSILSMFTIPKELIYIFMLFLIFCIFLYVLSNSKKLRDKDKVLNIFNFLIAITFSGLIVQALISSVLSNLKISVTLIYSVVLILTVTYYLGLVFIIYKGLEY